MIGSSIICDRAGRRKFRRVIDFDHFVGRVRDAVTHAGRRGDEVDIEFALETLLHDFHVKQAEKAAAETEAECGGIFWLVEKSGVIELQFAECIAEHFVIACVYRKQAGKDHRLDCLKAGKRRGGTRGFDDCVAHARVGHALDVGDDEANVAGCKLFECDGLGRERAESFYFVDFVVRAKANFHARGDAPFHHANENDGAAISIEPRIENKRAKRRFERTDRRRNIFYDGFENLLHAKAAFGADEERFIRGNRENTFDLFFCEVRLRGGQVDFVDDGNDREIMPRCEKRVGDSLRFDALARIHNEQCALACGKGARNFVGKIDVARRVDEI